MNCCSCGAMLSDNAAFCTKCGAKQEKAIEAPIINEPVVTQPTASAMEPDTPYPHPAYQPQPAPVEVTHTCNHRSPATVIPLAYKPLSAWGYVGYQILFSIPLVGLVCLIIFSCGASSNKSLTNFARSYWCWLLVLFVILLFVCIVCLILGISFSSLVYGASTQMY